MSKIANNKMKVSKNVLNTILISAISITLAIVPLVLKHPVQASEQDLIGICGDDGKSQCVHTGNAAQYGDKVVFTWKSDNADFYNVRYRSGDQEKQVGNTSGSFTLKNVKPNSIYKIKVQACKSRFLASSKCSDWMEISFTSTTPSAPKPYGVDTCNQGYVWREAQPSDRVCVTPAVRTQTRNENNSAAERREPTGGAYGPNTCKQGYVWREATTNDPVCVTPQVRDQAAEDNKRAGERRVP
jgi:hypothetical protein